MARKSLCRSLVALSLLLPLASRLPAADAAETAARQIDRNAIEGPLRVLADDRLEGRLPGTRGDELTQLYLENTLRFLGYEPGGEGGTYRQPFELVGITTEMPETWDFTAAGKIVSWKRSDEYIAVSAAQKEAASLESAELVFVGYGIEAPEHGWNDFKGMDLSGKVLVMLNNDPDWDPELFEGERRLYYGRWDYKYLSAARQKAAGAIIVHTTPSAGYGWQVIQSSWTGEQFELPAGNEPRLQVAGWGTEEAVRRLVAAGGHDLSRLIEQAKSRDFKPVPLGIRTTFSLTAKIEKTRTANVAGLLRGSDPRLKDEVVVLTAHHDHLGTGEPDASGDRIYNGAVDNAAGCAQVLAIAKAFATLPERPKRSILILFVGAEEQGLLGSKHYAANPTFPPGGIAANVNFDGGNIHGKTADITFIGFGKSSLDALVTRLAARQGRKVLPDQFPDRGYYYRSDQFSFAQIGVPAIYLDTGTEFVGRPAGWGKKTIEEWDAAHYHQQSDNFDPSWNFDGMIEDARLGFEAALAIAEDPQLPTWMPGDEFEAARKKALEAVR